MSRRNQKKTDTPAPPVKQVPPLNPETLRRQAEEAVNSRQLDEMGDLSPEAIQQILHDLHVHKIELEMQNEELRRAQSALEAAREQYFDLFDLAPAGYCTISEQGMIIEANLTLATLLEAHGSDLVGLPISRFINKDDKDIQYLHHKQLLVSGNPQSYELRMRKKDGSIFWARFQAIASQDLSTGAEQGAVSKSLSRITISDITDKKLAEETLHDSEERFRAAFMSSPNAIAISTMETGEWVDVNQVAIDMFGYTREEVIGKSALDTNLWVDPDDRHTLISELKQTGLVRNKEMQLRCKNGNLIEASISLRGLTLKGKNHLLFVTEDITERKRSEEALRTSEEMFKLIATNTPDHVVMQDSNLRYLFVVNPQLGLTEKDMIGKTEFDILSKDEAIKLTEIKTRVLETGKTVHLSTSLISRTGDPQYFDGTLMPRCNNQGRVDGILGYFRNVTEQRKAEEALQASEERYRAILEQAADSVFMHDITGRILDINEKACESLGYSREELISRHIGDIAPKADLPEMAETWNSILAGEAVTFETSHIRKDGRAFPVEVTLGSVKLPEGDAILGIARNITERKRVEESLHQSEAQFRSLIESAPEAIYVQSGGHFVYLNRAMLNLLGSSCPDELLGREYMERVSPEYRDVVRERIRLQNETGEPAPSMEQVYLGLDGSRIDVEISAVAIQFEGKRSHLVFVRDITERKRTEAERMQLMAAIEQAGESIVITDALGKIQFVNPAFERMTGYLREEAIGGNPNILKSGKLDKPFYKDLWDTISSGKIWSGRLVNRRKDGSLYTEEMSVSPVRDNSGKIIKYVAVKKDITEQLRLTGQLQQAQKMEAVGRLAGGVAHDFNNMLSVILGNIDLVLMDNAKLDQPMMEGLQEIRKAAMRSVNLTRQLLAFARKQVVSPKVLDLNETIESTLKMIRRLIGEDINLAWLPDNNVWPVKMDPAQIDQILANLCINSRDAITGVGKIEIKTGTAIFDESYCVDHPEYSHGEYALLSVTDNGCGMSTEILNKLFEPFFTTKEMGKGTGLGLATVYGIVKQNSGFITVRSEPGFGTTFNIYIPRFKDQITSGQVTDRPEINLHGNETVLLVEDEEAVLKIEKTRLELLGYRVLTANSTGEAVKLAGEHTGAIHLLFTDVVMPDMNGKDLSDQLKLIHPELKCLFMSGYTADVIAQQGILEDGINFIHKPFSIDELALKVREVFDKE